MEVYSVLSEEGNHVHWFCFYCEEKAMKSIENNDWKDKHVGETSETNVRAPESHKMEQFSQQIDVLMHEVQGIKQLLNANTEVRQESANNVEGTTTSSTASSNSNSASHVKSGQQSALIDIASVDEIIDRERRKFNVVLFNVVVID